MALVTEGDCGALAGVFRRLEDRTVLDGCDLHFEGDLGFLGEAASLDHQTALKEGMFSDYMGKSAAALVTQRLRSSSWHWAGLPGIFPGLCHPGFSQQALGKIKVWFTAFAKAELRSEPFWKKLVSRRPFALSQVKQVVDMLREAGWQVMPLVQSAIKQHFSQVTQTKVVEDVAHDERFGETLKNANNKMKSDRIWNALVSKGRASNTHRYEDIPWLGEHLPRGCKDIAKDTLHHLRPGSVPKWLRTMVGAHATPSWYSPRPVGVLSQREDLALLQHCYERDSWSVASATRATFLLYGTGRITRGSGTCRWALAARREPLGSAGRSRR